MDDQTNIVSALLNADAYPHPVTEIQHIETHISHVFLTGSYAYKIKKPIVLDFLDFGTLEKRRMFCERELELNQRFSRELYLEVVEIGFEAGEIRVGCRSGVLEYAVRMKQFPASALFSELLTKNQLNANVFRELGERIAIFHREQLPIPNACPPDVFWQQLSENLPVIRLALVDSEHDARVVALLNSVEGLCRSAYDRLRGLIQIRNEFAVKELHGDLHLGNICLYNGRPLLFDCLEFNTALSRCDTYSDLAFLLMDLRYRDQPDFAALVLDSYLKVSDDWEGLPLLPLFESYRACVRAKVACITAAQHKASQAHSIGPRELLESAERYLQLAEKLLLPTNPRLLLIGGLSGSGKTALASEVAPRCSALHLSSDVIRKHKLGIPQTAKAVPENYSAESRASVYQELFKRAEQALRAGFSVVIDASFQDAHQRAAAERLADELGVSHLGIWCTVDRAVAFERIARRREAGIDSSDADESVLTAQLTSDIGAIDWLALETDASLASLAESVVRGFSELESTGRAGSLKGSE